MHVTPLLEGWPAAAGSRLIPQLCPTSLQDAVEAWPPLEAALAPSPRGDALLARWLLFLVLCDLDANRVHVWF